MILSALGLVVLMAVAAPNSAEAGPFKPGQIEVDGYGFSGVVTVEASQLAGGDTHGLREVLQVAEESGEFRLSSLVKVQIAVPGKVNLRTYTGEQIRTRPGSVPKFRFEDDATVMILPDGAEVRYASTDSGGSGLNPRIQIPVSNSEIEVSISPEAKKIKSGETVKFTAKVTGATGELTYRWSFGDGRPDVTTGSSTVSRTFKGSDRNFGVTLTVTDSASTRRGTASALIIIGKAEKTTKKKPKKESGSEADPPASDDNDGYYGGPGYGNGYGDDYGSGNGSSDYGSSDYGSSGDSSQPEPKKKRPEVVVDDGLETVRGELLDPSIPGEVIDPANPAPSTGPQSTSPEESESGGFGLSGGAKTAIGIAFLLGLGGLTELRAFGRFR